MDNILGKIVEVKDRKKGRVVVHDPSGKRYCVAYLNPSEYTPKVRTWKDYEEKIHFHGTVKEFRLTKEEFEQIEVYGFDTYRYHDFVKVYGDLKHWFIKSLEEKY